MKRFSPKKPGYLLAVPILFFLAVLATDLYRASLRETGYFTGWILLTALVLLTLLNWRKKAVLLPLGRIFEWVQIHIYLGWLSMLLFCLHISWRIPNGVMEAGLAVLFAITALSGVLGLYLSLVFPRRLARRGEEVIFERIPAFRAQLFEQAQSLALSSVAETRSTTLSDFFSLRLYPFFIRPRNLFQHLLESNRARFILFNEMIALERYMNEQERRSLEQLKILVGQKDDLDYHFALQGTLKLWLFIHIPATIVLWTLILLHLILVYVFQGGVL
ncbi:MAG: hypothetical protein HQL67_12190 [Magnetococcales bacterium]|nr:hypothetical protein [Magnetococcales bacterium]